MTNSVSDFSTFPKIELHLHVDCSLTHRALQRLGHDISETEFRKVFVAPEKCTSLVQYLSAIAPSCAILQTAEALRVATEELVISLADERVIYEELRFAPHTHQNEGLRLDEVMDAVTAGVAAGCAGRGIRVGLLLCALRDFPVAENMKVIELAARWRDRGVVGVDIAGDEARCPVGPNMAVFDRAHDLGLPVTAHAGEALGPESVIDSIEKLSPARIGHGVRSIENAALMDLIKERGLHLEVCPSSNIQTGVYPSLDAHPIDRLSRLGVSLGINTDARTVAPLSLTQEYQRLADVFGWAKDEFLGHNIEAARHAFQPEKVRDDLVSRLVSGWS